MTTDDEPYAKELRDFLEEHRRDQEAESAPQTPPKSQGTPTQGNPISRLLGRLRGAQKGKRK